MPRRRAPEESALIMEVEPSMTHPSPLSSESSPRCPRAQRQIGHEARDLGLSVVGIDSSPKLRGRLSQTITATEQSTDHGHLRGWAGKFKADALFL
jgi:hypothetical protein